MLGKVLDAHRLIEIVVIGRLSSCPQIPAAHAAFRIYPRAIEWLQPERLERDANARTGRRRGDSAPC